MKQLIGNGIGNLQNAYTFTPGAAGSGIVTITGVDGLSLENIMIVTNLTRDTIIYIPQVSGKGATAFQNYGSTSVLTLDYDTSTHSSGDVLQIWYDASDAAQTSLVDLAVEIKYLLQRIADPQWANPAGGLIVGSGTLGTVTGVTTVSTVSVLTNLSQMSGIPTSISVQDQLLIASFAQLRSQIATT